MNPIIVIGLVSVVTAGMYGMYDGLDKQAELAALHADMLARQHAAHTTYVSGVMEEKQHVIISNNGPQPAELIQVRAYDDTSTLTDTWEMSYVLPPLQEFNMSSATMPTPPSDLTGSALENSLDNDNYYRGVTSAGSIFEIVLAPSSGTSTPDGAYPMSAMPLNVGGSGSTSHAGGISVVSYYYANTPIDCDQLYVVPGNSYTIYREFVSIHSPAYSTSTSGPGTPWPAGTPTWYELTTIGTGSDRSSVPACSTFTSGLSTVPSNITPFPGHTDVYHETLWTSGTTVNINLRVDGDFTSPSDGDMLLRVMVPVSTHTSASYDGSNQLMFINQMCQTSDNDVVPFENTAENTFSLWESSLGSPILTPSFGVRANGASAGNFDMSDIVLVGGAVADNRNFVFDMWADGGGWDCTMTLTADVDGSWSHAGVLVGMMTINNVAAGDIIEVDGTARLRYTPPTVANAAVDTTNARLEVGDAVIAVGITPP